MFVCFVISNGIIIRTKERFIMSESERYIHSWQFVMLQNAHTTKSSFYVTVISCDLGVACFSVHGS